MTAHVSSSGGADDVEGSVLVPEQEHRLRALYATQHRRPLTEDEWREMDSLVAAYNERLCEQGLEDLARSRAVPVEVVRSELDAERDRLLALQRELNVDPPRRAKALADAWRQQRERAFG